MIFKNILSIRYRLEFKLLACSLVFSLILSISGCTTTEIGQVKPENLDYKMNYEFVNIILKNGLVIDLRDIPVHFVKEYKDKKNVIVYTKNDIVQESEDSLVVSQGIKIIELNKIQSVTMETTELDTGKTILVTLGVIAAIGLIIIILLAIAISNADWKWSESNLIH
jgi:hypothetical protein